MGSFPVEMNRELMAVLMKSVVTIALAAALAAASVSAASAAKHAKHAKMTGACVRSSGRCIADCDQLHWCQVFTCVGGKSTPVPFWRCYQPSGLCLAPHC
ncbi:MAG: hypothetical protein WBD71_20815 [Xanthobacteraceae bacterium]